MEQEANMSWTLWGDGALTAADVRKLPAGTYVFLHHHNKMDEHCRRLCAVIINKLGQKVLAVNEYGYWEHRPIRLGKEQYFTLADFD